MPTEEQQELIDFIGVGGKLPSQIEGRFGDTYGSVLTSLIANGYAYENVTVLRETAATPELAAQAAEEIVSYLLTDEGKFALRL